MNSAAQEMTERLTARSPWLNPRTGRGSLWETPITIGDWSAAARGKEAELKDATAAVELAKRAWFIEVKNINSKWPGQLNPRKPQGQHLENIIKASARVEVVNLELKAIQDKVSAMLEAEKKNEPCYSRDNLWRWGRARGLHREELCDGLPVVKGEDGIERFDLFGSGELIPLPIYFALGRELREAGVRLGGDLAKREARIDDWNRTRRNCW